MDKERTALYLKLRKYYNVKQIFNYLNLLQKTGITNMLGAASFLYIGKEMLEHEFKYKKIPNEELFDELLNNANEIRDLMIQGAMNSISENNANDYVRSVERKIIDDSKKILQLWMNFKGKIINESNNKTQDISFLRRREAIIDLIDNGIEVIRNDTDVCDYTFSEFLTEVSWQVSDNSDEMGIELNSNKIDLIHRWVRNNFSQYIKDEYLKLIDIEGCNDYDEDDIDDDYLSGFLYGVDNN